MKTLKTVAAVLCVAGLALPAAVFANGPSGHGKSGEPHGHNHNSHCKHQPKVGFALGGTLDPSSTASNIVVDVTHANKSSKPFVTNGKYTVPSGSTVQYEGSNPFTTQGADLSKYRVQVIGKVIKYKKGCTASNSPSPTIKKVIITAPDAADQPDQQPQS